LDIDFETAPNLSENVAFLALESHICKRMDPKQLWGQERQVVMVSLPRSMVGSSRECVRFAHASAWLVVKCEVEAGEVK
jgi:hypothetical protein